MMTGIFSGNSRSQPPHWENFGTFLMVILYLRFHAPVVSTFPEEQTDIYLVIYVSKFVTQMALAVRFFC